MQIKQRLYSYLIRALDPVGAFPIRMTEKKDIESLLDRLHPAMPEKPLIRLGPKGDGGYLVPDDLIGIPACFSPGVNFVSGFEKDCAELGMDVYMADASVDRPADIHPRFHFEKKFVGVTTNETFMTMDNWVDGTSVDPSADLLLQIDIEGFEYEVFLAASDDLMNRFRIIVVEFHQLTQLWDRSFFRLASRAFDKLLQTHVCVHIHPNNCCGTLKKKGLEIAPVTEFTFLRRDRLRMASLANTFPHPLDADNTKNETLVLPKCWYAA